MTTIPDAKRNAALEAEARRLGLQAWQLDAIRAVGTDVVRTLVSDFRRGPAQPSSIATKPQVPPAQPLGWREPTPLGPPPGTEFCDRLMDHQDKLDRRDLERRLRG
jgi:hypothetical protein